MTPRQYVEAAFLVALMAFCGWAGWAVNGWRLGDEVATVKQQHAEAMLTAKNAAATELAKVTRERDTLQVTLSTIAGSATAALTKAQNENDIQRDCVRRGTCGVRIAATCPANPPSLPASASRGSVDTGASAQLTPEAGENYFSLKAGIIKTEGVLAACQASLRAALAVPASPTP